MALITCPECGKEVSDKAAACPHCGNPINKQEEQIICCPNCGSNDIYTSEQGFSGLKAAAGMITVGAVGALLGTHGSKDLHFTCKKCGKTFNFDQAKKQYSAAIVNGVQENIEDKVRDILLRKSLADAVYFYRTKTGCDFNTAAQFVKGIQLKDQEAKINNDSSLSTFQKEKKKLELEQQSGGCASVMLIILISSITLLFLI